MSSRTLTVEDRAGVLRLRQWRCPHCSWRLFDANLRLCDGEVIQTVCRGCRQTVTFTAEPEEIDDNPRYVV